MTTRQINEKAAELLRAAAGYVLKGHVRKVNARTADGAMCDPENQAAACWCAQGALYAAFTDIGLRHPDLRAKPLPTRHEEMWVSNVRERVMARAKLTLLEAADAPDTAIAVPFWNDEVAEDGVEVAATMVAAAEKLEAAA